jgi:phenylpyruvate tautomerase PptA (4-oxalocrotonate tautomerase family)
MEEMPYLQLDAPFFYPAEVKRRLARRLGEIYSRTMNSNINRLTVAIQELARRLVDACKEILGLSDDNLNVEFTQHAGDEMYHTLYGGLSDDWNPDEPDRLGS